MRAFNSVVYPTANVYTVSVYHYAQCLLIIYIGYGPIMMTTDIFVTFLVAPIPVNQAVQASGLKCIQCHTVILKRALGRLLARLPAVNSNGWAGGCFQ